VLRLIDLSIPGLPVLWEAFLAIYRPALGGLERYFTLYFAVGANGLMHLSWTGAPPAAKSTVTHVNFSVRKKIFLQFNKKGIV
jgi:hypothetical protein